MKINIAQVRKEIGACQSFSFHMPAKALTGDEASWLTGEATVEGEVVNTGRLLLVSGTITAATAAVCHRCLSEAVRPVSVPFQEEYQEAGSSRQDPDMPLFEGDELSIAELVRESVIMAEPIKHLCDEACQGLCPVCGANRNSAPCGCDTRVVDPRLAALEKLLSKK